MKRTDAGINKGLQIGHVLEVEINFIEIRGSYVYICGNKNGESKSIPAVYMPLPSLNNNYMVN